MVKGKLSVALIAVIVAVLVIASAFMICQRSSRAREMEAMQKAMTDWDRAHRGQTHPVPTAPR